jgi:hypothetical protein
MPPGGEPITGMVRCEFVPTAPAVKRSVVNWDNHGSYRPTAKGLETATLTVRERPHEPRRFVPPSKWDIVVTDVADDARQLPLVEVTFDEGFRQGFLYELIYEAQDPLVMGVGFTAVRDLVAALKRGEGDNNPLLRDGRPFLERAYGFGVSQSGRFLREFLYWGCNGDEQNRKVFDGLMPHVAGGGLGSFNHRFAQPTRHCNQHDHHDYPADRFPFAYESQLDPYTAESDGILQRTPRELQPYVLHTQSSAEYWTRSGSLVHTDPKGRFDASPPDNVRIYAFGGTQHGPAGYPPSQGNGKYLSNPGDYRPLLRALLIGLDDWCRGDAACPASVYPRLCDGTLVDWHVWATGFPDLPGVLYPEVIQQPPLLYFGPRWRAERVIDVQPPQTWAAYRTLVPRCNEDGNELGCLSPPEVTVPDATYTGWNLRSANAGAEDELVSLVGSYFPLSATQDERQTAGDPRASLQERYGDLAGYLEQLDAACRNLEESRYLLAEDRERIFQRQRERLADRLRPANEETNRAPGSSVP